MKNLRSKRALVTGASRGIGRHIARCLARRGTDVVVTARSEAALQDVASELAMLGVRAHAIPADITDHATREKLVQQALEAMGGIDLLVNNAGLEIEGAFESLPHEDINRMVDTNLTSVLHLTRLVLPGMIEARTGHVATISSLAGKKGPPFDAVYAGTKAALIEWSGALRMELESRGVGVSVICPGYVRGEGMFARFGIDAPKLVGTIDPERVAEATVRAIERNEQEVIVNQTPMRPMLVLGAISPKWSSRLVRWSGVESMQRRKAFRGSE